MKNVLALTYRRSILMQRTHEFPDGLDCRSGNIAGVEKRTIGGGETPKRANSSGNSASTSVRFYPVPLKSDDRRMDMPK
jgi:hypothetical protein